MNDPYPTLHQTFRVGLTAPPSWGGVGTPVGTIEHGIEVPHGGANVRCEAVLGEHQPWLEQGDDTVVLKRCRQRLGHATYGDGEPHVPVDIRLVAAPRQVVKAERFKPNHIPRGVDMTTPLIPHDCANHLPDTVEVLRRGW